jgi:uncharacterized SAM-binding protein YcdF (DUF218 family)
MTQEVLALAEILWDYHHMHHVLAPADVILVLCSHDLVVADRGADLFLAGYAPLLVVSGGSGAITRRMWREPEAEVFARRAIERGVPRDQVLLETRSTNTGENVRFTRELLAADGLDPERFIVVQKPYMERRAFATFRQVWPEKQVQVTSPQLGMREYLARYSSETLRPEDVISIMVGDLQRIRLYPARGFQVAQEIPGDVWQAYEALVARGFDRHLVA